jgi:hypothetical protein
MTITIKRAFSVQKSRNFFLNSTFNRILARAGRGQVLCRMGRQVTARNCVFSVVLILTCYEFLLQNKVLSVNVKRAELALSLLNDKVERVRQVVTQFLFTFIVMFLGCILLVDVKPASEHQFLNYQLKPRSSCTYETIRNEAVRMT